MTASDRSKIKRYFSHFPLWALVTLGIAIVVMVTRGILVGNGVGLLATAVAVVGLVGWGRRPSDRQMDQWLREELKRMEARALVRNNVTTTEIIRDPVTLAAPRWKHRSGADSGIKRSGDRKLRYTPVGVTVIHFTEHQLVIYECVLDLTTGNALNEKGVQYFYNDVVAVEASNQAMTFRKDELDPKWIRILAEHKDEFVEGVLQMNAIETFKLTTKAGNSIEVAIQDLSLIDQSSSTTRPPSVAEEAARAVQAMLRAKKVR